MLNVLKMLKCRFYQDVRPLNVQCWEVHGEPVAYDFAVSQKFTDVQPGYKWGGAWDTAWFKIIAEVPKEWTNCEVVSVVEFDSLWPQGALSSEGMVWIEGKPAGAINRNRNDIHLLKSAAGGERIEFYIEVAANEFVDFNHKIDLYSEDFHGEKLYFLKQAELACLNREAVEVYYDIDICRQALAQLPKESYRYVQIKEAFSTAERIILADGENSLATAHEVLQAVIAKRNGDVTHQIFAVGHSHIDTAWLWPLRETIRKCGRTFSTMLQYMDDYDDFKFSCSQALQYAWMKEYYPSIFENIKKAVRTGQWEPTGAMWVEPDCNISSGESLIRQIFYGLDFYKREFGIEMSNLWLPDVFGYSAAMPQILRSCGIDNFMTQKLSWNDTNRFPFNSFIWKGLDGSDVLTHFPPADTYNGVMSVEEVSRSEHNSDGRDQKSISLYPFGHGDGGGGATRGMIERAKRLHDFNGLPKVKFSRVDEFFDELGKLREYLPVWSGELYLEKHRGTYTTQGRLKRLNRECEFLLRDAEFFDAIDFAFHEEAAESILPELPSQKKYDIEPYAEKNERGGRAYALEWAWKILLMNQFHDIIPGSSINRVNNEAADDYGRVKQIARTVLEHSIGNINSDNGENVLVFNTLCHARREVIEVRNELRLIEVLPCGYSVNNFIEPDNSVSVNTDNSGWQLDNDLLRVRINKAGNIAELYDYRMQRDVISFDGLGNVLELYDDRPREFDAWDIDIEHRKTGQRLYTPVRIEILESSPLRCIVKVLREFGNSRIEQDIILRADSARLDFATKVNWQETHKLLKAAFDVDIFSNEASFEVQFGHVKRPAHLNTSWDIARFETCCQKWVDISEDDCGVALLNNGKYGHDIHEGVMRISLLRSPLAPDPEADRGHHEFTYSLLPHMGSLSESNVIEEAYNINSPLIIEDTAAEAGICKSYFQISKPGIVLETAKVAQEGHGIILRFYNPFSCHKKVELTTVLSFSHYQLVDMLERPIGQVLPFKKKIQLFFTPFKIFNLRLIK